MSVFNANHCSCIHPALVHIHSLNQQRDVYDTWASNTAIGYLYSDSNYANSKDTLEPVSANTEI